MSDSTDSVDSVGSEWINEVVKIKKIEKHPKADTLSIAYILQDIPIVIKTDSFKENELAFYISVDTVVPDTEEFYYLCPLDKRAEKKYLVGKVPPKYRTIKSKKIRDIYSEGLLCKASGDFKEGDDITEYLALTKVIYEEEVQEFEANRKSIGAESGPKSFQLSKYALKPYKKYGYLFEDGEECVILEKLEGENISYTYAEDRLWVKSRTQWKMNKDQKFVKGFFSKLWNKLTTFFEKDVDYKKSHSAWWDHAIRTNIVDNLKSYPYLAFIGEYVGNVKGFMYDCKVVNNQIQREVKIFDIFDIKAEKYLEWDKVVDICNKVGLQTAPVLYSGPWKKELLDLAEGNSVIGNHIKEGIVIRSSPIKVVYDLGRKIIKHKGKDYKLFKK